MAVRHNTGPWDKSKIIFQDGRLLQRDKKKSSPQMQQIEYGVALLRRAAIERIGSDTTADLAGLYSRLVSEGSMIGCEVTQRFYEIGTPQCLAEADEYSAKTGGAVD